MLERFLSFPDFTHAKKIFETLFIHPTCPIKPGAISKDKSKTITTNKEYVFVQCSPQVMRTLLRKCS